MHLWMLVLALFVAVSMSFGTGFLMGNRFGTAACTKVWSKRVTQLAESVCELRAEIEELHMGQSRT